MEKEDSDRKEAVQKKLEMIEKLRKVGRSSVTRRRLRWSRQCHLSGHEPQDPLPAAF